MTSPNIYHIRIMAEDRAGCVGVSREHIPGVPDDGWRLKVSHEFKENVRPFSIPRLHQMLPLIGLSLRYTWYWWKKKYLEKKRMFIDQLVPIQFKPIYAVPIGGIGCGSIGRGYRGEFCRFQMVPGIYEWEEVDADQFIVCIRKRGQTVYQQVLSPLRPRGRGLTAWNWAFNGDNATYHGLYPRSWTVYDLPGQNVRLICRQVSPVFPNDYKDTSLPAAVFVWSIENKCKEPVDVSIMFTFKNGQGTTDDRNGGCWNEPFESSDHENKVSGVMIHQKFRDMPCTYAVAAKRTTGVHVSHKVSFDPNGTGQDVWSDLMHDGNLDSSTEQSPVTKPGEEIATAVCAKCRVPPHASGQVEFSLTWDMPVIHFGAKERLYCRRYSRWFGTSGKASPKLASYSLNHYHIWENKIDQWQKPVIESKSLPSWYKSALFNELYYVSDGGTVWLDPYHEKNGVTTKYKHGDPHWHIKEYGIFGYLEGHEYRMYNTYDVHHYASFALIMLWPKLQLSIQYDIAKDIFREDNRRIRYFMEGTVDVIKYKDSVPHDLGDPEDEPWIRTNCYCVHPTHDWKDLNTKFALQVYRDYIATGDEDYLREMYPKAKAVMEHCLRFDTDGDGLIENGGFADQTYDSWTMHGASAYCGGLWLAAVYMMIEMAKVMGDQEIQDKYKDVLEKGKASYEKKLWNGSYYNYDSSTSGYHDSIMSDQLAGHWYLKASGVPDDTILPKRHIHVALETIFKSNVMPFKNGMMGAINGMRPDGKFDTSAIQAEEFWCGVTYALAATMIQEGMIEEGFKTAQGVYHTCYEWLGLGFQTPEAYFSTKHYRSLGYMRPLGIWAMQWAVEKFHPHMLNKGD